MWLQMNLVLHMKCWVFPFILKIPHLPLIIVIFVSPFLDEYISIAFLPRLFIKYRHQGPNAARFPTCLTRWLSTLQDQPGPPKTQLLPFTSTHTTSSPRCRIPTPGQGGSCLPGVYWYFCNCMSSQGLGELLWMWWWRNISIPFFFFLMHSTFSMHLSLFSGLHMRASRLKPYCQAEARRTCCEVTEEEKGSLPPAHEILPRDLPRAHYGSALVWEVNRGLRPLFVWQMVTVFLGLLACVFGFLTPHFKMSLLLLAFPATHF